MPLTAMAFGENRACVRCSEHFSAIEDPGEPWKVAHPLPEVLLLAVCGTIADCDDYEHIAAWGEAHPAFLRELLPFHHGVPGGRCRWSRADSADESDRSRAVLCLFHGLGPGDVARTAGFYCHRWQDIPSQP